MSTTRRVVQLTNVYLSDDEYAVFAALPSAELRKTRSRLMADGRAISVDEFQGRHRGLVLAEIELAAGEASRPLPPLAVADVSDDDRYSGGALAWAADDVLRGLLAG